MAEVVANGIRTHVQTLGTGEREVFFVHGICVDNMSSLFFTLANPIAQIGRAVLYDLRGHGKTQRPPSGYDLDTLLDDMQAVMQQCSLDRPIILGHSYGGLLALAYAARHADSVGGLVLIDPPLPLANWGIKIAEIFNVAEAERERRIRETYDAMHGSAMTRKRKRMEQTIKALVYDTSLLEDMRASRALTQEELAAIQCPVLAVYGDTSEIIDCAKQMSELLPHADVQIFPGYTHRILFEGTQVVRKAVLDWLEARA